MTTDEFRSFLGNNQIVGMQYSPFFYSMEMNRRESASIAKSMHVITALMLILTVTNIVLVAMVALRN